MPNNNTARSYFNKGDEYFKEGKYDDAEKQYEKALELEPDNTEFKKKLADVYDDHGYHIEAGSPETALTFYKKALSIDPLHKRANNDLSVYFEKHEDYDALIKHYEDLIPKISQSQESPFTKEDLSNIYTYCGSIFFHIKNDPEKSKEFYLKAISINSENILATRSLGLVYDSAGQTELAIEQFHKVIEIFKKNDQSDSLSYADLYNDIGNAYLNKENNAGEAQKYYQLALSSSPANIVINRNLGRAYGSGGQSDLAIEQFQKTIEILKKSEQADPLGIAGLYNDIGSIYLIQKNNAGEAQKYYQLALESDPANIDFSRNLGIAYNKSDQSDLAIEQFQKTVEILKKNEQANPFDFAALYNDIGDVYLNKKNNADEALKYYQFALISDPGNIGINRNIGLAYEKAEHTDLAIEHYQKIIENLKKDLHSDPLSLADVYNDIGNVYLNKKNNAEEAQKYYLLALSSDPANISINRNLGIAYDKAEQSDLAIEQFQKVIELLKKNEQADPLHIAGLYNDIGSIYLNQKNNSGEAQKYYNLALSNDPANIDINQNLGLAYNQADQPDLAIEQFQKTIEILKKNDQPDPLSYADLYNSIGNVFLNQKNNAGEAQRYYQLALSSDPHNIDINRNLGIAYDTAGQSDLAIEQFQKVVELFKKKEQAGPLSLADLYNDIGCVYLDSLQDSEKAIEYYEKALDKKPDHNYAIRNLGLVFYRTGKYADALTQYYKALNLLPEVGKENFNAEKTVDLLNDIGNVYVSTEEYDEAIKIYNKALSVQKDNIGVIYNLGFAYEQSGKNNEAISFYKKAIILDQKEPDPKLKFAAPYLQATFLLTQQRLFPDAFDIMISAEPGFKDSADFLNAFGNLYFDVGQYSLAEKYYKKALIKEQDFALAQHNIAYRYEKCGDYAMARTEWEKAFTLYRQKLAHTDYSDKAILLFYYAEAKFYSMLEEDLDEIENMYNEIIELEKL